MAYPKLKFALMFKTVEETNTTLTIRVRKSYIYWIYVKEFIKYLPNLFK